MSLSIGFLTPPAVAMSLGRSHWSKSGDLLFAQEGRLFRIPDRELGKRLEWQTGVIFSLKKSPAASEATVWSGRSRALPNPTIIGPPDPAVTNINPPPPRKAAEEAIAEKVINVAVTEFEPPVIEEVEEVEEVIEEVVIKVVPIEAMVKVGVMDKF